MGWSEGSTNEVLSGSFFLAQFFLSCACGWSGISVDEFNSTSSPPTSGEYRGLLVLFSFCLFIYKGTRLGTRLGERLGVRLGSHLGVRFCIPKSSPCPSTIQYLVLSPCPLPPLWKPIKPACTSRLREVLNSRAVTPTLADTFASECVQLSTQPKRFAVFNK